MLRSAFHWQVTKSQNRKQPGTSNMGKLKLTNKTNNNNKGQITREIIQAGKRTLRWFCASATHNHTNMPPSGGV
jgi:hypothetical protein